MYSSQRDTPLADKRMGYPPHPANTAWKTVSVLCALVLVLALQYPLASAETEYNVSEGDFVLSQVEVNRVNLALKEIDIVVDAYVVINSSFLMVAWIPWREGGTFLAEGTPVQNSTPWHEYHLRQMPMKRLVVTTTGHGFPSILGVNTFPFEAYETEMFLGFNATAVRVSTGNEPRATLSPDLEQEGKWNVTTEVKECSGPFSKWPGSERIAEAKSLKSFLMVSVTISHPDAYVSKMSVPVWGPIVFLLALIVIQFGFIRRKLRRAEHVGMFIGASVLALGQTLSMRDVTPPELTLAELINFSLVMIYLLMLALVMKRQYHDLD
jgi:hypothetical protein